MNAVINHPAKSLFIDQPNVSIPVATQVVVASPSLHSTRSFSDMGRGKFRRLFNRHTTAFRR